MRIIIKKEKSYEDGKFEITYCVRIKYTKWYDWVFNLFLLGQYNEQPIAFFDTLKEARKCKELCEQHKWTGSVYSKEVH